MPLPHGQWFKSAKPGDSWNHIREYILSLGLREESPKRKRPPSIDVRNRQRRRLACEKRNDKDDGLEDVEEVPVPIPPADANINDGKEDIAYGAVMKKSNSSLGRNHKAVADANLLGVMKNCWDHIAPNQLIKELCHSTVSIL